MSIKKGILYVFIANIVNFTINILINFLLPKCLSVNAYSVIKTFQFYTGYIGIMHFGYVDGMYLKYGGKSISNINRYELEEDIVTMRIFQIILSIFGIAICIIIRDYILMACMISILPQNMKAYYSSLCSAVGEFKQYAAFTNYFSVLNFAANILLLCLGFSDQYFYYIVLYIFVDYMVWILWERKFYKEYGINICFKVKIKFICLYQNIKDGILLMLGNLASMLLTGEDRWCILIFMDETAFAQYSFCVSLEGIINFIVLPMSRTFYNYFCIHQDSESIHKLTDIVVLISTLSVVLVFPLELIVRYFIVEYSDAMSVLIILFAAQIFYVCIKCIYLNLYKAFKKQRLYFIRLVTIIVAGGILNVILYSLYPKKESFAIGTLISSVLWFMLSVFDFREYRSSMKTYVYIFAELAAFLICGVFMDPLAGWGIYACTSMAFIYIWMRKEFVFFCNELFGIIKIKNR